MFHFLDKILCLCLNWFHQLQFYSNCVFDEFNLLDFYEINTFNSGKIIIKADGAWFALLVEYKREVNVFDGVQRKLPLRRKEKILM